MNARMIGDVLHTGGFRYEPRKPRQRRDGNGTPVWRNSYNEGQLESRLWRPIAGGKMRSAKRLLGARLKAARTMELRTRIARKRMQPGTRNGSLGPIAVEVLEYMNSIVDFLTGKLDPAISTIADAIGRSYGAVKNALDALRDHGFIQWIRRCRPLDNKGEPGPQAVQISNAYVLLCPEKLRPLVAHMMSNGPIPADEAWRREQRKQQYEAMLAQLSTPEFLEATWDGDSLLGETFMRIAQLLDQERESIKVRETGVL